MNVNKSNEKEIEFISRHKMKIVYNVNRNNAMKPLDLLYSESFAFVVCLLIVCYSIRFTLFMTIFKRHCISARHCGIQLLLTAHCTVHIRAKFIHVVRKL